MTTTAARDFETNLSPADAEYDSLVQEAMALAKRVNQRLQRQRSETNESRREIPAARCDDPSSRVASL